MRYLWDSFRWRFIAAFYIAWWFAIGAPMKDMPFPTRWANVRFAWRGWRFSIMFRHERHKYRPIQEVIAELESK